jgi:hypothetical protein
MVNAMRLLCPDPPRRIPGHRWLGVVLRTGHILTIGTLLGGHVFAVDPGRLVPFLVAAIVTGVAMMALEMASTCAWLCMGKGLAVLLKLVVLLAVPIWWDQRVPLLIAVTVVASVTSHMPSRYRHYSLIERRSVMPPPRPLFTEERRR